jgi:Pyridoxamine 5'-phosphate oxidase
MIATRLPLEAGFDLDAFLERPLVAHVAAAGPSVRPVWFLWEDGAFWWLTGGWARLPSILKADPSVALVVDTCDLESGTVHQLTAEGDAEIYQLDAGRARRMLQRYLGARRVALARALQARHLR